MRRLLCKLSLHLVLSIDRATLLIHCYLKTYDKYAMKQDQHCTKF